VAESTIETAAAAITEIDRGADPAQIADILLSVIPVDGGAVSTLGDLLGAETISATSDLAARLDEVQFDLGEGPCWDALARRRPVLEPDFAHRAGNEWPHFTEQVKSHRIGALFAFPLTVGPMQIGAIDFYTAGAGALTAEQIAETSLLAAVISRVVLRRAIRLSERELTLPETEHSRRVIHQATGIIIAQLRLPPEDALLILRGRAFASGRSMMEIATDVVARRVSFTAGPNGIEDSP
jgi:hypothetical protein